MMKGKAWKYGDNVDTDVIIPARYLTSTDPEMLKTHCMEDLDPGFAKQVSPGDFIVAGANFGCGSSREHAPLSIKAAGVSAVIAGSFARIFFRNSFNIGLPILESREAAEAVASGDELEIDLSSGRIKNMSKGTEYQAVPVPDFMQELISAGGLLNYAKKRMAEGPALAPEKPIEEARAEQAPRPKGARMAELEAEKDEGKAAPWVEENGKEKQASEEERMEAEEAEEAEEENSGS